MEDNPFGRDADYARIRRLIEQDLQVEKERRGRFLFRLNVGLYIFFLLFVWVRLFPIFEGFWDEWWVLSLVAMSLAGFIQVLIHWVVYRMNTSAGERALRDRLLGSAVRGAMEGDGRVAEKAKRRPDMSDDESDESPDEDWSMEHTQGHRSKRL